MAHMYARAGVMDIGRKEFFANFGHGINDLILSHRENLESKRKMRFLKGSGTVKLRSAS